MGGDDDRRSVKPVSIVRRRSPDQRFTEDRRIGTRRQLSFGWSGSTGRTGHRNRDRRAHGADDADDADGADATAVLAVIIQFGGSKFDGWKTAQALSRLPSHCPTCIARREGPTGRVLMLTR